MNDIQEEIFRSIENLGRKESYSIKTDYPTIILGIEGNGKYKVKIDGVERIVKDGINLNPTVGTNVWVHAMNGNIGQLYIMSKR